jgi:hypothetical protein
VAGTASRGMATRACAEAIGRETMPGSSDLAALRSDVFIPSSGMSPLTGGSSPPVMVGLGWAPPLTPGVSGSADGGVVLIRAAVCAGSVVTSGTLAMMRGCPVSMPAGVDTRFLASASPWSAESGRRSAAGPGSPVPGFVAAAPGRGCVSRRDAAASDGPGPSNGDISGPGFADAGTMKGAVAAVLDDSSRALCPIDFGLERAGSSRCSTGGAGTDPETPVKVPAGLGWPGTGAICGGVISGLSGASMTQGCCCPDPWCQNRSVPGSPGGTSVIPAPNAMSSRPDIAGRVPVRVASGRTSALSAAASTPLVSGRGVAPAFICDRTVENSASSCLVSCAGRGADSAVSRGECAKRPGEAAKIIVFPMSNRAFCRAAPVMHGTGYRVFTAILQTVGSRSRRFPE